jgi:hypothetical protein
MGGRKQLQPLIREKSEEFTMLASPSTISISHEKVCLYKPKLIGSLRELNCPHPGDAGVILNQLFWILTCTDWGFLTKDGLKWYWGSYKLWTSDTITGLSEDQFGKVIRWLVNAGFILKSNYAELRHFLTKKREDWHPYLTTSFMTINTERIRELTGFVFSTDERPSSNEPESFPSAEIANTITRNSHNNNANFPSEFSTIYKEDSISTQEPQNSDKETDDTVKTPQEWQIDDPWDSPVEVTDTNSCSTSSISCNEDKSSAPKHPTKTTDTTKTTNNPQFVVHSVVHNKQPQSSESEERKPYIWEESVGYPNEYFLNWRYEMHYKPQGGKWETGGRAYARKEFYNDPAGADVIYQEFLEFFNRVAHNAHQQQNQEIQAILPACLAKLPNVTQENKEQLAENIATVAARGAGVALRDNFAPGSTQHMSFEEAASTQDIKALPTLGKPALPGEGVRHWRDTLSESQKFENDFALNCAKWKLPGSREKALEWALQHSDKVQITEYGLGKLPPTQTIQNSDGIAPRCL